MLREVIGWLQVICNELHLDGILFVPAHFYMAALGRRYLHFLKPEDAAVFDAFQDAVTGLDLAEATWAIDTGRVVCESGCEPVDWHRPLMVLFAKPRLQDQFNGVRYEEARRRARDSLRYSLSST